jgi:hypothetical protein
MRTLIVLLIAAGLASPTLAQPDPLQRCRALADATARLACYDAIPAAPAAQAAAADKVKSFGLPQPASGSEPETVQSRVAADFDGWGPNQRIRLENGQVWQVTDGSSGVIRPGRLQVTVRKGALGSFYLDFEGLTKSPKVRRVQ